MKRNSPERPNQKGGASIVFVLLVSLVVLASSSKVFKDIKNTQEIGTAVNAISHAESGTRLAAQAFGLYLQTLSDNELITLPGNAPITMRTDPQGAVVNEFGVLTAEDISVVQTQPSTFDVTATFVNRHQAARSSASLQVVYNVSTPGGTNSSAPIPAVVNFGGGLNVNGGIHLINNGDPVDLVVDGDVNIGGASVNAINELRASGSITIGSNLEISRIFSDDDIVLNNTKSDLVRAMGTVHATGSAAIGIIQANDDVRVEGSGRFDQVESRSDIVVTGGGSHGLLVAGGDILITNSSSVDTAEAIGDISIDGWFRVGEALAMGDIDCRSQYWRNTRSLIANGMLNTCPENGSGIVALENQSNIVTIPDEITPVSISDPVIDVWALKDEANYVVQYDDNRGRIIVTVNEVNGLIDGARYTLGEFNVSGAPYKDYLCEKVTSNGKCVRPSTPTAPLCFGWSYYNNCISYNRNTRTWRFEPTTTAPGVLWFDGNVSLNSGHGLSTILATGDITTNGKYEQWAPNRGGYDRVCAGDPQSAPYSVRARYTEAYSNYYPTNLCDKALADYTPEPIANIGMAAGGVDPDRKANPSEKFSGGDINLGANTEITGAVLAGNVLSTSGQVTVKGLVAAAARQNDGSVNDLGSSTTIEFNAEDDYDPFDIPEMGAPGEPPMAAATPTRMVTILWSRPL